LHVSVLFHQTLHTRGSVNIPIMVQSRYIGFFD
jgi:hypothetical protein